MNQESITAERIDELPMLVYWLKQMEVDVIIDKVLGTPHGNWEGLSYGELGLVFIAYIVMNCTHFLGPVEGWVAHHLTSLSQARMSIAGDPNPHGKGGRRFSLLTKTLFGQVGAAKPLMDFGAGSARGAPGHRPACSAVVS